MEFILNVDWVAIVVAAVVAFIIGAVWYSPALFQKAWMKGNKITREQMDRADGGEKFMCMLAQAIATLVLSWITWLAFTTGGWVFAILIALGIMLLVKANGMFAMKGKSAIMVETFYILVMVVIMVIVHGLFM